MPGRRPVLVSVPAPVSVMMMVMMLMAVVAFRLGRKVHSSTHFDP